MVWNAFKLVRTWSYWIFFAMQISRFASVTTYYNIIMYYIEGHSHSPWIQKNVHNFWMTLPSPFSYNYLSCSFLFMSNFNTLLHYWVIIYLYYDIKLYIHVYSHYNLILRSLWMWTDFKGTVGSVWCIVNISSFVYKN